MKFGSPTNARWKRNGTPRGGGPGGRVPVRRPALLASLRAVTVGRSKDVPSQLRAGWLVVLAAMVLALSWQSFLTQTHRHFDPVSTEASAQARDAAPSGVDRQSPSDLPANCQICREVAHAGSYLLPAPIGFDAPAPGVFWLAVVALAVVALVRRSHAWRSRAPPSPLPA